MRFGRGINPDKEFGQRECPSCATEVPINSNRCPICKYEFPYQPGSHRLLYLIITILLLIALLGLWAGLFR